MAKKPRRKTVDPDDGRQRCQWASQDAMLAAYHDLEWGYPIHTDSGHLERMALEIFQCGLSWKIVLMKRPALRKCFQRFKVDRVAGFTKRDVNRLCRDASIIRNRLKIEATIHNARKMLEITEANGSYRRWLASFPTKTPSQRSQLFSMFHKVFKFMGPETTKCYMMGFGKIPPTHDRHCWLAEKKHNFLNHIILQPY